MKVYVLMFNNDKNEVVRLNFINYGELVRYLGLNESLLDNGYVKIKVMEDKK